MPWRETKDPYAIIVSEIMLQQTQVSRVIPKYKNFLKRFPDFVTLAAAPVGEVLRTWQGLGYNRRALALKRAAETVMEKYGGRLPHTIEELDDLSGIGPATAAAIYVYSWNMPAIFIETNIRTVFIHHFFPKRKNVKDEMLLPFLVAALSKTKLSPREWYYALMDYGTFIKHTFGNAGLGSAHYVKQSRFKGSNREVRGFVLRVLSQKGELPVRKIVSAGSFEMKRVQEVIAELVSEGFIRKQKEHYSL